LVWTDEWAAATKGRGARGLDRLRARISQRACQVEAPVAGLIGSAGRVRRAGEARDDDPVRGRRIRRSEQGGRGRDFGRGCGRATDRGGAAARDEGDDIRPGGGKERVSAVVRRR